MDPATATLLASFIRMALTSAFTFAKLNNINPDEVDKIFDDEFAKFKARNPADLPDV